MADAGHARISHRVVGHSAEDLDLPEDQPRAEDTEGPRDWITPWRVVGGEKLVARDGHGVRELNEQRRLAVGDQGAVVPVRVEVSVQEVAH
eukprot:3453858-Prymnesium_polylepis.1